MSIPFPSRRDGRCDDGPVRSSLRDFSGGNIRERFRGGKESEIGLEFRYGRYWRRVVNAARLSGVIHPSRSRMHAVPLRAGVRPVSYAAGTRTLAFSRHLAKRRGDPILR